MKIRNLSLLVFIFLTLDSVLAQSRYQKILEASYEAGPLLGNGQEWSDELERIVDYHGIDIKLGWRSLVPKTYNYLYRYPFFGLGFNVAIPYYPEVGRPQVLYLFGEFPLLHQFNFTKLKLSYFTQIGLGFNLNPYDPDRNPINRYIGSKMNAFVNLGIKANYRVSDRIVAFSNFGLKHFSNGSTKKPNAGINLIPLSFGVRTTLGKELQTIPRGTLEIPPLEKRNFLNIALYAGFKNYDVGAPTFFRGGLGVNYLWTINYKYNLGLGADVFFAPGMDKRYPSINHGFLDQFSLALVGSWEWKISKKVYVPIGLGAYLKRNQLNDEVSWYYERAGVRYRFDSDFFAGFQIKAHKSKADFFEFTLGYTIPGKVSCHSQCRNQVH